MNDVAVALLSLLLGAVIGGLSKLVQDGYTRRQEARAVAAALRAELSVLVEGIRRGGHVELIERIITYLSDPMHVVKPDDFLEVPVSQTPSQVFTRTARRSACWATPLNRSSEPMDWQRQSP